MLGNSSVNERLAVYGSLQPGGKNHDLLADLDGVWVPAFVHGTLHPSGWAADDGYLGLKLSDNAPPVSVLIFYSRALPSLWAELDEFEGSDYRRTRVCAWVGADRFLVNIYELASLPA